MRREAMIFFVIAPLFDIAYILAYCDANKRKATIIFAMEEHFCHSM